MPNPEKLQRFYLSFLDGICRLSIGMTLEEAREDLRQALQVTQRYQGYVLDVDYKVVATEYNRKE